MLTDGNEFSRMSFSPPASLSTKGEGLPPPPGETMNRLSIRIVLLGILLTLQTAGASALPAFTPDANMERSEIPEVYTWDLSPIIENNVVFEKTMEKVNADRERLTRFKGKLGDPLTLRLCLDEYFSLRLATNKLTLFAALRYETARTSTEEQARNDRALTAMNSLMAEASFIRQEILALNLTDLETAYTRIPELKEFRPYIEGVRRRYDRVLGAEAENLLSMAGDNLWAEIDLNELPSDHEKTFGAMMSDIPLPVITDENGEDVQLSFSNYSLYRRSPVRSVRRDAVESFFAALRQFEHVFAGTMAGQVNLSIFFARARGYDTTLEAYLDMDDIDPAVYHNLISAIRANLAPLHRYVELRKKVLGLDDLHIYDLYTPLVPSTKMDFTYEEAKSMIQQALAPLGKEYLDVLATGMDPENRWIDLYPHEEKESGAYSASVYGVHPYVKMNYLNDFNGVSTLAHEFGHALHTHLSNTNQPYITADYASFIAEIASTFNETLLSDYLLENAASKEEKLSLLNHLVESIRTTIYRQALFAEFELAAHTAAENGTPITAGFFEETYTNLVRDYYGDGFTVGENDGLEWSYVGHFYYKFYMYTYATGLSSGIALAEKVATGDPEALEAYLGMLKGGSSRPPLDLLKSAGVDLTKPDAIEASARLMDRTITEMEKLLGL